MRETLWQGAIDSRQRRSCGSIVARRSLTVRCNLAVHGVDLLRTELNVGDSTLCSGHHGKPEAYNALEATALATSFSTSSSS